MNLSRLSQGRVSAALDHETGPGMPAERFENTLATALAKKRQW